jgi:hypothetical protein
LKSQGADVAIPGESGRDYVIQLELIRCWLCSNSRKIVAMEQYGPYINLQKPAIGLYVCKGASLPGLADKEDWVFDGNAGQNLLSPGVVEGVEGAGHPFSGHGLA